MSKTLVIIPTYNESDNIETIIKEITAQNLDLEILVVDDNSPDKTHEKVLKMKETIYGDKLHLLLREGKEGLAKAYIAGFNWGLKKEYDILIEMDADLSHNPKYLPSMLEHIKQYDLVIGSRYVPDGGVVNWSLLRKFISFGGSTYARTILGLKIKDVTGGFKCFRADLLRNIDLNSVISLGYSFQVEMNYRASLLNADIKEIPIIFEDRVAGVSKMSRKIFVEALLKVLYLRRIKSKILKEYQCEK